VLVNHAFNSLRNGRFEVFMFAKGVRMQRSILAQELLSVHILDRDLPLLLAGVALDDVLQVKVTNSDHVPDCFRPLSTVDLAIAAVFLEVVSD